MSLEGEREGEERERERERGRGERGENESLYELDKSIEWGGGFVKKC